MATGVWSELFLPAYTYPVAPLPNSYFLLIVKPWRERLWEVFFIENMFKNRLIDLT